MPKLLDDYKSRFPEAWSAYENLRDVCDQFGPLDRKTVELIKIGVSTALTHEGGVVAHVSQARKAGASDDEIYHAILLSTGQAGFPAVLTAITAARKYLGG